MHAPGLLTQPRIRVSCSRERGISLIEMMIAMTLGLLVIGAMTTIFVNNSQSRRELDKAAQQLENGRYAIQILRDEISMAGYYDAIASLPDTLNSTTTSACSGDVDVWKGSMDIAVQGFTPDTFPCSISAKGGTELLFVQRASTAVTAPDALNASNGYLQVSLCGDEYVSAVADKPFRLKAGSGTFDLQQIDCKSTNRAPIRQYLRRAFFIAGNNVTGDAIPTLKRADFRAQALGTINPDVQALVEGIEDMHFEYAIDTSGDGSPDTFADNPAGAQLQNIVGVRLWLLARALEPSPGYDASTKTFTLGSKGPVQFADNYKRHVFSTYVELIHPVGRRTK